MSLFDDVESQPRNRLEAKEFGLSLPRGNEKMHFKWSKSIEAPEEHARAMVLLQGTQELSKQDWEPLCMKACNHFGEDRHARMLKENDSTTAPLEHPKSSLFGRQDVLSTAIKARESGGGLDWEERIPQVIDSLHSGDPDEMIKLLRELAPEQEEQREMRDVRGISSNATRRMK
jgi:hypothetical protein